MKHINVKTTQKKQVIDITEELNKVLSEGEGVVNLLLTHTTAALTTTDLDPDNELSYRYQSLSAA